MDELGDNRRAESSGSDPVTVFGSLVRVHGSIAVIGVWCTCNLNSVNAKLYASAYRTSVISTAERPEMSTYSREQDQFGWELTRTGTIASR